MSVSNFLSTFADKAQSAINQTPLAGHVPGTTQGGPSVNQHRSLAFESLQHQIRSLGQQYGSVTPLQRIITLEKGVALAFDAVARDGKSQSKELYTWGQHQAPDLTDVTDRLAYLNFVQGSLSASLATKLDGARAPLKALRDAEAAIMPKRNIRAGLRTQIARFEQNQEKGGDRRLAELKQQLLRAESTDEDLEKEIELLKRKAIRESEEKKWEAIQEYAEKLILASQAAKPIIGALPTLPPTTVHPYAGTEVTATARASLQHALDNYERGQVNFKVQIKVDQSRSDTRSFGESHASELSSIASPAACHDAHPGVSVSPPIPEYGLAGKEDRSAPVPTQLTTSSEQNASANPVSGMVQDSGTGNPGVSHSEDLYATSPVNTGNAEEAQQRVEKERAPAAVSEADNGPLPGTESAEEEKKRLEREERERVLAGGANTRHDNVDELPPYQEIQEE